MNMANSDYQDQEIDYQVNYRRSGSTHSRPSSRRRASYARANRAPVSSSHNGIHRRRNKRFSW